MSRVDAKKELLEELSLGKLTTAIAQAIGNKDMFSGGFMPEDCREIEDAYGILMDKIAEIFSDER